MCNKSDVFVIVPAFNEEKVIADVLKGLLRFPYNVIVVDDGSEDNTVIQASKYPVNVLKHIINLGQGAALQTGIEYSLSFPNSRFVVTFDSDGQHDATDIPKIIKPLESGTHDVVLGSRFLEDGEASNISKLKSFHLQLATIFTNIFTGLKLTDTHNGLRAFTADAVSRIRIKQNRMAHASELLSQISYFKFRYCEIPVKIKYTNYSTSKGQSMLNSINILWELIRGKIK